MGFGAGVSTRAIVVSILLVSMKIFTPLGGQLERGRKRLFNRGIWVGNRGKLLVVTSVTAIRDPPKLSMHPMRRRKKAMSMSCTTGQPCTATARQTPDAPDVALVRSIAAGNKHAMLCLHVTTCGSSDFVLRLVGDNSAGRGRQVHHRFFQPMRTELLVRPIGMEGVVESQLLIQEE
jgi:hypothetical protein